MKFIILSNGKLVLKHNYYFKVQGQLNVKKLGVYYFIMWTSNTLTLKTLNYDLLKMHMFFL